MEKVNFRFGCSIGSRFADSGAFISSVVRIFFTLNQVNAWSGRCPYIFPAHRIFIRSSISK